VISFLIIPVLICGIIWIKYSPYEALKVSTYQGWIVYLYAASFGLIAVIFSWLFLDIIIPILLVRSQSVINSFLSYLTFDVEITPEYLNALTQKIINGLSVDVLEADYFSVFLSIRIIIISIGSIVLTRLWALFYKGFAIAFGGFESAVLSHYKHSSPVDYQLALIHARIEERESIVSKSEAYYYECIGINKSMKNLFRNFSKFCLYLFTIKEEDYEQNTKAILGAYRNALEKQRTKKRALRKTL